MKDHCKSGRAQAVMAPPVCSPVGLPQKPLQRCGITYWHPQWNPGGAGNRHQYGHSQASPRTATQTTKRPYARHSLGGPKYEGPRGGPDDVRQAQPGRSKLNGHGVEDPRGQLWERSVANDRSIALGGEYYITKQPGPPAGPRRQ